MSKIDSLVLASLERESLSLSEIINKISSVNVEKVPTRIGVHARLKKLNQDGLIVFSWYEGKKIYSITAKGIAKFRRFINQLTKLSELLIA
jgi:DNA-binding PadR family transcriptional regulator